MGSYGDMAVPAVPGAVLAMVEAEIVLGAKEALLDRPAPVGGAGEFGQRRGLRRVGESLSAQS